MKRLLIVSMIFLSFDIFSQKIDTINLKSYFGDFVKWGALELSGFKVRTQSPALAGGADQACKPSSVT